MLTFAEYGILIINLDLIISLAISVLRVGGSQILTFIFVDFQITFPAQDVEGSPSIPVTVRQDFQVEFR